MAVVCRWVDVPATTSKRHGPTSEHSSPRVSGRWREASEALDAAREDAAAHHEVQSMYNRVTCPGARHANCGPEVQGGQRAADVATSCRSQGRWRSARARRHRSDTPRTARKAARGARMLRLTPRLSLTSGPYPNVAQSRRTAAADQREEKPMMLIGTGANGTPRGEPGETSQHTNNTWGSGPQTTCSSSPTLPAFLLTAILAASPPEARR